MEVTGLSVSIPSKYFDGNDDLFYVIKTEIHEALAKPPYIRVEFVGFASADALAAGKPYIPGTERVLTLTDHVDTQVNPLAADKGEPAMIEVPVNDYSDAVKRVLDGTSIGQVALEAVIDHPSTADTFKDAKPVTVTLKQEDAQDVSAEPMIAKG